MYTLKEIKDAMIKTVKTEGDLFVMKDGEDCVDIGDWDVFVKNLKDIHQKNEKETGHENNRI